MRHSLSHDANPKAHIFPVNDVFETKDGKRLTLGILEEHFWNNFLKLAPELSDEAYSTDAKRRANGDALSARLAVAIRGRTADEWSAQLDVNDVPFDLCLTPALAAELPHLRERGGSVALGGERFASFPVFANGKRGGSIRRGVPALGEHSREIMVELGFDDAGIADLVKSGAVKIA
jgi:crotonobetainyl-CoA:carnitine CoA-transferase CaiB-like acyl-CoA transferase